MKILLLILSLSTSTQGSIEIAPGKSISWKDLAPWGDAPPGDYKKHITLHLLDQGWKIYLPDNPPEDPAIAYQIFRNEAVEYKTHEEKLENAINLLRDEYSYVPYMESIFISHGLFGNAQDATVENIIMAMAMSNNMLVHYNVFVVDFEELETQIAKSIIGSIFGRKTNYYYLAKAIGDFVDSAEQQKLMSVNKIHFVGFCFSAQVFGFAAKYIKELKNEKVKSILALDPHSLGLYRLRHKVLRADDAETVHVYHTNSIMFGTLRRGATADVIFNGGWWQPGCEGGNMCSHIRSIKYLWFLILYPERFVARRCWSGKAFDRCQCQGEDTLNLSFPPRQGIAGRFYIRTTPGIPYAFGASGANC